MFLLDHFPDWRAIYFNDTPECLKAVAEGQADCLLISNYRYNNISGLCDKYRLTTWSTGVEMDYCFAVNRDDTLLYSILSKTAGLVPESTVNASLTFYFAEDARTNVIELLKQNLNIVVIIFAVILIILCVLLYRATKEKKGSRGKTADTVPKPEDFILFDDLPISYSVYHVIHSEHSELYDAEVIYINHKYEELGGLTSESVLGHTVREMYPYIGESWYQNVRRAAMDGEDVQGDYVDPIGEKKYRFEVKRVISPGYCAVTYMEIGDEVK
jgi:PAS domain-containing protein